MITKLSPKAPYDRLAIPFRPGELFSGYLTAAELCRDVSNSSSICDARATLCAAAGPDFVTATILRHCPGCQKGHMARHRDEMGPGSRRAVLV